MNFVWIALGIISVAGALGGLVNALMTDNGFFLPCEQRSNDSIILRPGFVGNMLIGVVSALTSWGLYSSFGSVELLQPLPSSANFTLASVIGALLVGMGGARWLTNEVDKRMLRVAVTEAANAPASTGSAQQMVAASPAKILDIAQQLQQPAQERAS